MSVTRPNIQDCGSSLAFLFDAMANIDAVDEYAGSCAGVGTGVVNGMTVTGTGVGVGGYAGAVVVGPGAVCIAGQTYGWGGGTVNIPTASTGDRRDTIVARLSGGAITVVCVEGTPLSSPTGVNWTRNSLVSGPVKADVSASYVNPLTDVPLSEVYVGYATTSISATAGQNIVDKSPIILRPPATQLTALAVTPTGYANNGAPAWGGTLVTLTYSAVPTQYAIGQWVSVAAITLVTSGTLAAGIYQITAVTGTTLQLWIPTGTPGTNAYSSGGATTPAFYCTQTGLYRVTCVAGGGQGAGGNASNAGSAAAGGGGGGQGESRRNLQTLTAGTAYPATIGAGGAAATNGGPAVGTLSITNVASSGGTATLSVTNPLATGDIITVTGLTHTAFNGTWTLTGATGSTVQFALAGTVGSVADSGSLTATVTGTAGNSGGNTSFNSGAILASGGGGGAIPPAPGNANPGVGGIYGVPSVALAYQNGNFPSTPGVGGWGGYSVGIAGYRGGPAVGDGAGAGSGGGAASATRGGAAGKAGTFTGEPSGGANAASVAGGGQGDAGTAGAAPDWGAGGGGGAGSSTASTAGGNGGAGCQGMVLVEGPL